MNFETLSNCSNVSVSDDATSNFSSFSSLSAYQDEFAELGHLVNPMRYPIITSEKATNQNDPKNTDSFIQYEKRIGDLSLQLQNSLKLNEKYKNDLYNLEKNTELKYYEKIDTLLRNNSQLESNLRKANQQIARLISNFNNNNRSEIINKSFLETERKYQDLISQNAKLQYEYLQNKNLKDECETQNKQLKIELGESKINFDAKNECVKQLKEKISLQFVEIQMLTKDNLNISRSLKDFSFEIECLNKSKIWFEEQLHECQNEKKKLFDDILDLKKQVSERDEKIDKHNLEFASLKNKCDVMQLDFLKEKEKFYTKLQDNSILLKEIEKNNNPLTFVENNVPNSNISYYENIIADLNKDLANIKLIIEEQEIKFQNNTKEQAEIMSQCVRLQKTNQHKDLVIQELEQNNKQIALEMKLTKENQQSILTELDNLKKDKFDLDAELVARNNEKHLVEVAIDTIREQFVTLREKYGSLKNELNDRDKQILTLQKEKQESFMKDNWMRCELEKIKEKEQIINEYKAKFVNKEEEIKKMTEIIDSLKTELELKENRNKELKQEKHKTLEETSKEIKRYDDVFIQYRSTVKDYESKVRNLEKLVEESNKIILDFKDNINILKKEVNDRDRSLSEYKIKCERLEINVTKETLKILNYCMQVFESNNNDFDGTIISKESVQTFYENLKKYLKDVNLEKNHIKNVQNFKNVVSDSISKLEERIKVLSKKYQECQEMLDVVLSRNGKDQDSEKINQLIVLLQVKDKEIKDKQRKHEKNVHLLLKKVKEHMKGRNNAEKQNNYIQDMYNALFDENNTLKLQISSKQCELDSLNKLLNSYTAINEKLKQTINFQEKVSDKCDSCQYNEDLCKKIENLESSLSKMEKEQAELQKLLIFKDDNNIVLQKKIQEMSLKNSNLTIEKNKNLNEISNLLSEKDKISYEKNILGEELKTKEESLNDFSLMLDQQEFKCLGLRSENNQLNKVIDDLNVKISYFSNEIKILNVNLQNKTEDLRKLEERLVNEETDWLNRHDNDQSNIASLKDYLQKLQIELSSMNSDKFFLQRLCSDLKLALKSHVSENKILKERMCSTTIDRTSSLPSNFPDISSQCKFTDDYINQLLKQNKAPIQDKPLIEIQTCLDTLRKEISTLQDQVVKKTSSKV